MELNNELANLYVEYLNVGAGIGKVFENTSELKPMKYKQAINRPDAAKWPDGIDNEHDRMVRNKVFEVVEGKNFPPGPKLLTTLVHARRKATAHCADD